MYWKRRLPHWIPDNTVIFVTWKVTSGSSLREPRCARIVADALIYGAKMYELHAWVVMPTHVHVVMKWTTARRCNQLLNRSGVFWQDESFDHWIRNGSELESIIAYVEGNPTAAGLKNWPWSSKAVGQAILSPAIETSEPTGG